MNWKRFDYYRTAYKPCNRHGCGKTATKRACIQLRVPTWIYTCEEHKDAWS